MVLAMEDENDCRVLTMLWIWMASWLLEEFADNRRPDRCCCFPAKTAAEFNVGSSPLNTVFDSGALLVAADRISCEELRMDLTDTSDSSSLLRLASVRALIHPLTA